MKFLIQHGVGDPAWTPGILAPAAVKAFARAVEDSGWDALAFTDHPSPSGRWVDSGGEGSADLFTSLGFCAAVTERVRLASYVAVLPYHNGFALAHKVATLDHLSAGRVTLGLGSGYHRAELFAQGADSAQRRPQADETLDVMLRAWRERDMDYRGARHDARGIRLQPHVLQRPHPPLWFHGNSDWGLEHAARIGQGWIGMLTRGPSASTIRTRPLPDLDAIGRRAGDFIAALGRHGRARSEVEIVAAGIWPMLDLRKGWSADSCLADVHRLAGMGVDWIALNLCGDDPAASVETVRAFGEQVVRRVP
ncbi:MAG: TIGR03619 family F420-dependent LLM class oxidoreductase [Gammaproteobacteria bacterium]